MNTRISTPVLLAIIGGVVLGALGGYVVPDVMLAVSFLGTLFVNALRIVIIPLVPAAVIVGIVSMGHTQKITRSIGRTLVYFVATGAIATVLGLLFTLILQPGRIADNDGAFIPSEITSLNEISLNGVLSSILPGDFVGASAHGNILGLVILSIFLGVVLIAMNKTGKSVVSFFSGLLEAMLSVVRYLMLAAPIGLFSLVGTAVAKEQASSEKLFVQLGVFTLCVLAAVIVHSIVILPLLLKFFAHRSPADYFKKTLPAVLTGFGTGSAVASLPITFQNVVEENDVDGRAGSIVLPLGAALNMNGTAIYLGAATLFIAQLFGVPLSVFQIVALVVLTVVVSIGSSLVPYAAYLLVATLMSLIDMPASAFAGLGLLLVVDWFFDRLRGGVNVWSDAVGAAIIAESFEFKTARRTTPVSEPRRQSPRGRQRTPDGGRPSRQSRPIQDDRGAGRPDREQKGPRRQRDDRRDKRQQRPSDGRRERQPRNRHETNRSSRKRSEDTEKQGNSPYSLPTPPFHVLEKELKPIRKPEPAPAAQVSAPPSEKNAPDAAERVFNDDSIKLERTKIAAQLASLRNSEKNETTPPAPEVTDDSKSTGNGSNDSSERRKQPQQDPGQSVQMPAKETPAQPEQPHQPEQPESQPRAVSYGRGRSRRTGAGAHPHAAQAEEPEKTQKEENGTDTPGSNEPEFSTENISFGRGKRKK